MKKLLVLCAIIVSIAYVSKAQENKILELSAHYGIPISGEGNHLVQFGVQANYIINNRFTVGINVAGGEYDVQYEPTFGSGTNITLRVDYQHLEGGINFQAFINPNSRMRAYGRIKANYISFTKVDAVNVSAFLGSTPTTAPNSSAYDASLEDYSGVIFGAGVGVDFSILNNLGLFAEIGSYDLGALTSKNILSEVTSTADNAGTLAVVDTRDGPKFIFVDIGIYLRLGTKKL